MEPYKKPVLTVPNTRNALLNRTKIGLLPVPTVPDTGNALLNRTKWSLRTVQYTKILFLTVPDANLYGSEQEKLFL